ncbi:hypothetical protein [Methylobacterium sp. J-070]|uniref:hypothetical protein n=1 Tax=Methylobacterium sp. J-070 TaxID=2836650 RepID=UPI001FBAF2BA|nr:hypothetical protein [Methylobacterium sp. J-070]MCJ2052015.1 hypothetical protein [Methylobacterium sp. J-070]
MSFVDAFRNDPAAWLARARAEPEEPLVGAPFSSMSIEDAERLEEAVSGRSPGYGRPVVSAGSAALGRAEPETGRQARPSTTRVAGGRSGAFNGDRERNSQSG